MRRGIHRFLILLLALPAAMKAFAQLPVDQQWAVFYDGLAHGDDSSRALVVDHVGNTIVAGAVQNLTSGEDWVVIKYDSSGAVQWTNVCNGPAGGDDGATALAVGPDNAVYVCGYSQGVGTGLDYLVVKYDAWGMQIWSVRYNGPADSTDRAVGLALDPQGNVIVTGTSCGIGSDRDFLTLKIDPQGDTLWTARYDGAAGAGDMAVGVAVDTLGYIYVTGMALEIPNGDDWATIKYSPEGQELWRQLFSGPDQLNSDAPLAIAALPGGGAAVTGFLSGGNNFGYDAWTVLYNADGDTLWTRGYVSEFGEDAGTCVAVDPWGNVVMGGYRTVFASEADFLVISYDHAGNQIWMQIYNGLGSSDDIPASLAVDLFGNVYVTGSSLNPSGGSDYVAIKYTVAGAMVWLARYEGAHNSPDYPAMIALSPSNHFIYITGVSNEQSTGSDFATVQFRQNNQWPEIISFEPAALDSIVQGDSALFRISAADADSDSLAFQWAVNGLVVGQDTSTAVVFDSLGQIRVCVWVSDGQSADSVVWNVTVVEPSGVTGSDPRTPHAFGLLEVQPNPFNASTVASYELRVASQVRLTVWDTAGRLVGTLVEGWQSAGVHQAVFNGSGLASGIYLTKLQANSMITTRKAVLLK